MEITIVLNASPELLNVLQAIAQGLSAEKAPKKTKIKDEITSAPTPVLESVPKAAETPAPTPVLESVPKAAETPAPASTEEITDVQVRAATMEKVSAGKRDAVKTLLTKFKVAKVSDLKKGQYVGFLTELKTI